MMLAEVTSPERFSPSSLRRLIGDLPTDKGIAETLKELARILLIADGSAMKKAVLRLERYIAGGPEIEPADLEKYRESIRVGNLLVNDDRLTPQLRGDLYDSLIRLAFYPLTYRSYLAIEACVGRPPQASLRMALGRCGNADILPWILVHHARHSDKWLVKLHDEHNVRPEEPLAAMATEVAAGMLREDHAPVVLDFALRYLNRYSPDPGSVLARYGFLAVVHEHMFADRGVRVERLTRVLGMCFAGKLSRPDIERIYDQPGLQPTAALEDAVAAMTDGKNRGYLRERANADIQRSQGLPPGINPTETKRSTRMRWIRARRWRQDRAGRTGNGAAAPSPWPIRRRYGAPPTDTRPDRGTP